MPRALIDARTKWERLILSKLPIWGELKDNNHENTKGTKQLGSEFVASSFRTFVLTQGLNGN